MSSSLYRQQLEAWLKDIKVNGGSVVDIGGGQLNICKRVGKWEVDDYKIVDFEAEYNPDLFFDLNEKFDCWKDKTKHYCDSFDVAFCLEVMEYIYNPLEAHRTINALLKPKGIVYISYPTLYPLHNPPEIDYLRYTKNAIEKLLSKTGFSTWEITPRIATDGAKALADFWRHEQMRPMKHTAEIYDIGYMVKAFKQK